MAQWLRLDALRMGFRSLGRSDAGGWFDVSDNMVFPFHGAPNSSSPRTGSPATPGSSSLRLASP